MRPALEELRRRLAEHNHKQEVIDEIIKQIEPFVGYGFNKSHSVAYSLIAYFTAYLKYHYREEFFTALLTVFESQDTKVSNYVQDARAQGISILKPSVNRSDSEFKIEAEGVIRYGLGSIKGLGEKAINEIASLRPFTDLADFIGRTTKSNVNKRSLQALVFSGALDELAGTVTNRMEILQILYGIRGDKDDLSTEVDEFNKRKMLEKEKELLKVYISGHPLEDIARPIPWEEIEDGERVVGHCMLSSIRRIVTKKGDPMAFIQLEFMEQEVEAVCFPRLYQSNYTYGKDVQPVVLGPSLKENMILKVTGHYEESSDGRRSFLLDDIVVPIRINKDKVDEIRALAEPAVTVPEELVRLPIYQAPLPGF